ncbi:MAG: RpiR family transcriptional regulator, carbohydrate utilization regulator [Clostridiales bacterium]|jgi:DNA-binding MurR/RpiR family transcriptional regulator|nr:RpiR family transcriptional regulator, carbohydrate utilization regulator [Clostridiales bacterium]MDK2934471.1 RpiR family transcriptional regulator, carbohydrate utilization regulator [Clostridiales bacterium]
MTDQIDNLIPENNNTEYLARIRSHYHLLSDSEKKIADYILKNRDEIVDISIHPLAKKTGTSAATVIRFCQALGFKGYTEFKFYIERELLSPVGEIEKINKDDSIKVIKQKLFNFNKEVIDDTLMILDDDQTEKAVDAISKAETIHFYGEGGSGSIAFSAAHAFLQIGLPCNFFNDAFLQVSSASQLKKGDVAIGITHSGRTINTIDAIKVAKERGATTICITGYVNSPITEYSDIILYTSSKTTNFLSDLPAARISELCIISTLQLGIITRNYEKLAGNIKKSKEAFELKRIPLKS